MKLQESKQTMPVIRQLFAGLSFFGLLLFGPVTAFTTLEMFTDKQMIEPAGFIPFGVIPTIIFALTFAVLMNGYWGAMFRKQSRKEN
jgi:hypothetical protein